MSCVHCSYLELSMQFDTMLSMQFDTPRARDLVGCLHYRRHAGDHLPSVFLSLVNRCSCFVLPLFEFRDSAVFFFSFILEGIVLLSISSYFLSIVYHAGFRTAW